MKNRTLLLSATAALMGLTACTAPAPPPDTRTEDLAAINQVRSDFQTAFNAGDAEALGALYADDAVVMNPGESTVTGRAAIQSRYEELFSQMSIRLEIQPEATDVGGDIGFDSGTYRNTATPTAGGDSVTEEGRYVVVLRRGADGSWRLIREIGNSPTMPPMP